MAKNTPKDLDEAISLIEYQERHIKHLLDKIENLEQEIDDLEQQVGDLEDEAEREKDAPDYGDDEWQELDELPENLWLDMREFLSDIGFDPTNLPSNVGERMAIARILEAARMFK